MAKGPANRYQSAAEMRADLVRVLSGQRPSAPAVMSAEDRTAYMGNSAGARTQVVTGRHRPAPVAEEPEYDAYDYEADEEAERKARRKRALTIAGVVLVCVAVLALAAWLTTIFLNGSGTANANNTANLPNVVNMTQAKAQETLKAAGFNNAPVTYVPCSPPPNGGQQPCTKDQIGNVITQDPVAANNVDKATAINLVVGKAPDAVSLPDVTGQTQDAATKQLQAAGLTVAQTTNEDTVTDPKQVGKVTATNPPAGSQVTQGQSIILTIGKPPDQVDVPDETGQDYAAAKSNLEGLGFKVSQQTKSSNQPKNQVLNQSPQGGGKAAPGTTITLTVSLGDQFTMPDLVGLTVSAAQSKLQQLGWKGQFSQTTDTTLDNLKVNTIESSNPDANQTVGINQTIQIQVFQFPGNGSTPTPTPTR